MRSHSARGLDRAEDLAGEPRSQSRILLDRLHEGIGDKHRDVEHAQPPGIALGVDEGFDVGMIAAQGRHHGAAAGARAHDGAAHRVPHIHEGQRTRGVGADARTGAPCGRSVEKSCPMPPPCCMVSAASRKFSKMPRHVVGDRAHDEAIEERDAAARAGAGDHPAGGQEPEPGQRLMETARPQFRVAFRHSERPRHAPPGGVQVGVGFPGSVAEAVFHVPDALGNRSPFHC